MPNAKWYADYLRIAYAESAPVKMRFLEAADMIESLSEQIEQVTRERDAAVYMLDGECYACTHNSCGEPSREK